MSSGSISHAVTLSSLSAGEQWGVSNICQRLVQTDAWIFQLSPEAVLLSGPEDMSHQTIAWKF